MGNEEGMTLVEVIVALAIFMILVVMAYPIITQSGMINAESSKRQSAEAQGVLLAEYLIYNASSYDNKESLITFLEKTNPGSDFPAFTCTVADAKDVCRLDPSPTNKLFHEIKFVTDNKVKVSVKYSKQLYESIVWLSYRNGVSDDG